MTAKPEMDERGKLGGKKLLEEFKKALDRHCNFIKRVMMIAGPGIDHRNSADMCSLFCWNSRPETPN
jgi:hypothetical protein